ncbi:MAG: hypothetical protein IPL86_13380 [Flavobacteriales bacterium]|nr:hypothetical protein [Flavobacteriales bacterium]
MVFTFPAITGVNDLGKPASPKVYPVPFTHHFTVDGKVDEHAYWVLGLIGPKAHARSIPTLGRFDVSQKVGTQFICSMFSGLQSKVVNGCKEQRIAGDFSWVAVIALPTQLYHAPFHICMLDCRCGAIISHSPSDNLNLVSK